MRYLFVNDNKGLLEIWRIRYSNNPEVFFVECQNVEQAVEAVMMHQPDVVMLDHHLSARGGEGLEVIVILGELGMTEGRKFYTTTTDLHVLDSYRELGIEKASPSIFAAIPGLCHADYALLALPQSGSLS